MEERRGAAGGGLVHPPALTARARARWPLAPRLAAVAVLALLGLPAGGAAAGACPAPPGFAPGGRLESAGLVVLFRTVPAPIPLGEHFAVEAVVCAPAGAAVSGLRVDAQMPEHRHGMNYRPRVSAQGEGRYRAEGLLLHMPGRWQLLFDVQRGGETERLAADVVLE